MRNNWLFFMDLDGESPYILPIVPFASHNFRGHIFSHASSFLDKSLYHSGYCHLPGTAAIQETFNSISKIAGALIFLFSGTPASHLSQEISSSWCSSKPGSFRSIDLKHITSCKQNLTGFCSTSLSKRGAGITMALEKFSSFMVKHLYREVERLRSCSVLSLAAAFVTPLDNLSSKVLAVTLDNTEVQMHGCVDHRPCVVVPHGSVSLSLRDLNWRRHAIEPKTGIEFPMVLDNALPEEGNSKFASEVLVGTGSRTMRIVKIKNLKVYAFGFYVHPHLVCEKLGPKYASISPGEPDKQSDFYADLLREDINMTVRLVVNCSGIKINTVRDAFEKSLRARLVKANPDTDYNCLKTFGSLFTHDIPLPAGTTIDFRRTAEGQLITEIGGNKIGAVKSKDLCRAFFDMYIGDVPVSEQTKEEIGKNVASIIRRC